MKQVSGRGLARAVEAKSWTFARVHGSHHIFSKAGRRERIVIPTRQPSSQDWLLRSLMKIADLKESDL